MNFKTILEWATYLFGDWFSTLLISMGMLYFFSYISMRNIKKTNHKWIRKYVKRYVMTMKEKLSWIPNLSHNFLLNSIPNLPYNSSDKYLKPKLKNKKRRKSKRNYIYSSRNRDSRIADKSPRRFISKRVNEFLQSQPKIKSSKALTSQI